ncbi:MAG: hypothetical protein H6977_10190 [Gammaproteobacteria bacterium]|nr:hypothetical protein [Gammaproteobacteria bacterium]MCP5200375.1 hypothetical protein [Gammaproteobacteria bacterium]
MPPAPSIEASFGALAQCLQALHEADLAANPGAGLVHARAQAVADIEAALSAVLDAFHAVYDAIDAGFPDVTLDWYGEGALALLLALRQARQDDPGAVRTLYRYHEQRPQPTRLAEYVFVDFAYEPERMDAFDVFLSWRDFAAWLEQPQAVTRLHADTVTAIGDYLGAGHFAQFAAHFGQPPERLFFNVVPLFVNAGVALIPRVSPLLSAGTTGGDLFAGWMEGAARADTTLPQVLCAPFLLPA